MAATAARRSLRSTAPGVSNGTFAAADARLGPRDALLHGRLGDQERAGDLRDGKPGDDAQRERDLLRGRQLGMAADEQQPQDVVAVVGLVDPLDQRRLGIREVGDQLLGRQRPLAGLLAHAVDRRVPARP